MITRLLIDEVNQSGRVNLGSFYDKRGLRLFPGLIAVCAVLLVSGIEWYRIAPAIGYHANYARVTGLDLGH